MSFASSSSWGFERITLSPGESRSLTFTLGPQELGLWDKDMRFTVEPGSFTVGIGASSQDIRLEGHFTIVPAKAG